MVRKYKGRCEVAVQQSDMKQKVSHKKVVFMGRPMTDVDGKTYDEEKLKDLKARRKKHAVKRHKSW